MRDRGETRKLTETGVWNWGAGSEGGEEQNGERRVGEQP